MTAPLQNAVDPEELLDEILADYIRAVEGGNAPDRQALLARHAGVAAGLAEVFADLDHFEQLALPLRAVRQVAADPSRETRSRPAAADTVEDSQQTGPHIPQEARVAGPTSSQTLEAIPGYEILGVLGRGGMGIVYKARHTKLKRLVAIKRIKVGERAGEEELARFRIEAEAVARLQHPNIVQIYEVGEHAGLPFFSLEFVGGGTLAKRLAATPQPPREAAELTRVLALAVETAHRRGIIHRDLKPANILLAGDGEQGTEDGEERSSSSNHRPLSTVVPKITDFGLAKRLDEDVGQTRTGIIMGTPAYMAPEQATGAPKELGPAADGYALGAILYEMLTGRPPFKGASVLETLEQLRTREPVSPRLLQPLIPRDLETICLKCLQKDPQRRYPSAADLAEDLRRFLVGEPVRARPVSSTEQLFKWVRRRPAIAALLLACGMAALAVVWAAANWLHNRELTEAHQATEAALEKSETYLYINRIGLAERSWWANNPERTRTLLTECPDDRRGWEWYYLDRLSHSELMALAGHSDDIRSAAVSPDGTYFASGGRDHIVKIWDAASGRELAWLQGHNQAISDLAFSPDGAWLAYVSDGGVGMGKVTLWELPLALEPGRAGVTREPRHFSVPAGDYGRLCFSPDGRSLAVACGLHAETPAQVLVFSVPDGRELLTLRTTHVAALSVAYSPDGRRLISGSGGTSESTDRSPGVVQVWDAATGEELQRLEGHKGSVYSVRFSADGRLLASAGSDRLVKIWDAATYRELETLRGHTATVLTIAFRPDGQQMATGGEDGTVRVWDLGAGEELFTLRGHISEIYSVAYLCGGQRLVSAGLDRVVRVWDATTSQEARTLSHHSNNVLGVTFSPDGHRLVSVSHDRTVVLCDLHGSEGPRILSYEGEAVWCTAFSHDGSLVAAGSGDWQKLKERGQVAVWDVATGRERFRVKAHVGVAYSVAFSPGDGKRLASAGGELWSPGDVKVWDTDTGQELLTISEPTGVRSIAFSPDGRCLAGVLTHGCVAKIWDATTGKELLSLPHGNDHPWSVAFSPDGRQLFTGGNGAIKVWDAEKGELVATLPGHAADVRCLAVSPDGRRLFSGSADKTVKVWETGKWLELLTLSGHSGYVHTLAASPDGQLLASGSDDGTVKIWNGTPRDASAVLLAPVPKP